MRYEHVCTISQWYVQHFGNNDREVSIVILSKMYNVHIFRQARAAAGAEVAGLDVGSVADEGRRRRREGRPHRGGLGGGDVGGKESQVYW